MEQRTSSFSTTTATTTVGCLAKLRRGTADAFLSDAVILLGIHARWMTGLCRAIDSALPRFLGNGWWSDFEANFDPRFTDLITYGVVA